MELRESQQQFVRLALDSSCRERLFTEQAQEENLFYSVEAEIRATARSLISKRMGIVGNTLALTRTLLGADFAEKFHEYARNSKEPHGINRHRLDSVRFSQYLAREVQAGEFPRALRDVLTHETIPLQMWMKKKRLATRFYRHDPGSLQHLVRTTGSLDNVTTCLTFVIWRESRNGQGYHWSAFPLI